MSTHSIYRCNCCHFIWNNSCYDNVSMTMFRSNTFAVSCRKIWSAISSLSLTSSSSSLIQLAEITKMKKRIQIGNFIFWQFWIASKTTMTQCCRNQNNNKKPKIVINSQLWYKYKILIENLENVFIIKSKC